MVLFSDQLHRQTSLASEHVPSDDIDAPDRRNKSDPIWIGKTFSWGRMEGGCPEETRVPLPRAEACDEVDGSVGGLGVEPENWRALMLTPGTAPEPVGSSEVVDPSSGDFGPMPDIRSIVTERLSRTAVSIPAPESKRSLWRPKTRLTLMQLNSPYASMQTWTTWVGQRPYPNLYHWRWWPRRQNGSLILVAGPPEGCRQQLKSSKGKGPRIPRTCERSREVTSQ